MQWEIDLGLIRAGGIIEIKEAYFIVGAGQKKAPSVVSENALLS